MYPGGEFSKVDLSRTGEFTEQGGRLPTPPNAKFEKARQISHRARALFSEPVSVEVDPPNLSETFQRSLVERRAARFGDARVGTSLQYGHPLVFHAVSESPRGVSFFAMRQPVGGGVCMETEARERGVGQLPTHLDYLKRACQLPARFSGSHPGGVSAVSTWRGSQAVRQRFAKPSHAGSNPVLASRETRVASLVFVFCGLGTRVLGIRRIGRMAGGAAPPQRPNSLPK